MGICICDFRVYEGRSMGIKFEVWELLCKENKYRGRR